MKNIVPIFFLSLCFFSGCATPIIKGTENINRGTTYFEQGNYNQAIQEYRLASQLNPQNPEPFLLTGNVYDTMGDEEKAISYYKMAKSLCRSCSQISYNLGLAYRKNGQLELSRNSYLEYLRKVEDTPDERAFIQYARNEYTTLTNELNRQKQEEAERIKTEQNEAELKRQENINNIIKGGAVILGAALLIDMMKGSSTPRIEAPETSTICRISPTEFCYTSQAAVVDSICTCVNKHGFGIISKL